MSVSDIYAKMLKDPKNRVSSSGSIRQPTPFDSGGGPPGVRRPMDEASMVSAEEQAFLSAVDRRMAEKKSRGEELGEGTVPEGLNEEIISLKGRVKELEELVTVMMKQQMKLMAED